METKPVPKDLRPSASVQEQPDFLDDGLLELMPGILPDGVLANIKTYENNYLMFNFPKVFQFKISMDQIIISIVTPNKLLGDELKGDFVVLMLI